MAPFEKSHTSSYSPTIITMALSCIVCFILRLIGRKSRNFYTPPVFSARAGHDPVEISWRRLRPIELEWWVTVWWKNYDNMLSRFHPIPETLRTDGRTDGETDRYIAISISRVSVLTRHKNWVNLPCRFELWPQRNVINHYYFKNRGFT